MLIFLDNLVDVWNEVEIELADESGVVIGSKVAVRAAGMKCRQIVPFKLSKLLGKDTGCRDRGNEISRPAQSPKVAAAFRKWSLAMRQGLA